MPKQRTIAAKCKYSTRSQRESRVTLRSTVPPSTTPQQSSPTAHKGDAKKLTRLCRTCRDIRKLMLSEKSSGFPPTLSLATDNLSKEGCAACHPILFSVLEELSNTSAPRYHGVERIMMSTNKLNPAQLQIYNQFNFIETTFELLAECQTKRLVGRAYRLDPEWISITTLLQWMNDCSKIHGPTCGPRTNLTGSLLVGPSWLLDVERMCIVPVTKLRRYITLSYVWGQVEPLKLLARNLEKLRRTNALSSPETSAHIPNTIKDAIKLVRLLGEQYLWTDTLCIVQDDTAALYNGLNSMASIYANAYLTIVAGSGKDADHGLPGIPGGSRPRVLKQKIYSLSRTFQLVQVVVNDVRDSTWSTRAWTFQEEVFSNKSLIFCNDSVYWQCARKKTLEESASEQISTVPWNILSIFPTWPNFSGYSHLVQEYNTRALTYPEDALRAFAGTTSTLSQVFEGGFVCGLPELFFDSAILWQPLSGIQRRKASEQKKAHHLPSWSWAGWQGAVRIPDVDSILLKNFRLGSLTTGVAWYCSETIEGPRMCLHGLDLARQYRQASRDPQMSLPLGWSRTSIPYANEGPSLRSYEPGVYYEHEAFPSTSFRYPIPLRENEPPYIRPLEPFLHCHTQRSTLYTAENFRAGLKVATTVRTMSGDWAGVIFLPNPEEYAQCLITSTDANRDLTSCELISVSEGQIVLIHGLSEERMHPEGPPITRIYEYVNVLWIEWDSGIAYRKAVGRVGKSVWQSLEHEWIDVTMN